MSRNFPRGFYDARDRFRRQHGIEPACPVRLVCGPPGSGKTTYVAGRIRPGELVIDLDTLSMALSGRQMYERPEAILPFVYDARDAALRRLWKPNAICGAWIIHCGPTAAERERALSGLTAMEIVVLEVSASVCMARIAGDARRSDQVEDWEPLVEDWWSRYEPDPTATIIAEPRHGGDNCR